MKRRVIKIDEEKCTGCGQCVPDCKEGAIEIVNGKAKLVREDYCDGLGSCIGHCPAGAISMETGESKSADENALPGLMNWPVQLMLAPVEAPYLKNADLVIAADCVPSAYVNFHRDLLKGGILLIGCPKLDAATIYEEKLAGIFENNNIKSVTVAHMEVPCCFGLKQIVREALRLSGKNISLKEINVGIGGNIR
jgi:NAD-dependent dihydropyrimidine dehydrogenase PreA subunit